MQRVKKVHAVGAQFETRRVLNREKTDFKKRRTNVLNCAIVSVRYEGDKSGTEAPNGTCRRVIRGSGDWSHLRLSGGHAPPFSGTRKVRSSQSVQVDLP